jgi:hypothetical protein
MRGKHAGAHDLSRAFAAPAVIEIGCGLGQDRALALSTPGQPREPLQLCELLRQACVLLLIRIELDLDKLQLRVDETKSSAKVPCRPWCCCGWRRRVTLGSPASTLRALGVPPRVAALGVLVIPAELAVSVALVFRPGSKWTQGGVLVLAGGGFSRHPGWEEGPHEEYVPLVGFTSRAVNAMGPTSQR